MLSQLLKPLAYLSIVHSDKKKIDWLYPLILSVLVLSILEFTRDGKYMAVEGGLVDMVLGFIQSLPGFYIAALAAVATFGKRGIDRYFPEPMPYIIRRVQAEKVPVYLTRRTFLCMLFAFLTYESILLVLFSIGYILIGNGDYDLLVKGYDLSWPLSVLAKLAYLLMLFQMVIATFWGLFYLGYRIHEQ